MGNQVISESILFIRVDEVTQFEIVCSVEKISERYPYQAMMTPYEKFKYLHNADNKFKLMQTTALNYGAIDEQ